MNHSPARQGRSARWISSIVRLVDSRSAMTRVPHPDELLGDRAGRAVRALAWASGDRLARSASISATRSLRRERRTGATIADNEAEGAEEDGQDGEGKVPAQGRPRDEGVETLTFVRRDRGPGAGRRPRRGSRRRRGRRDASTEVDGARTEKGRPLAVPVMTTVACPTRPAAGCRSNGDLRVENLGGRGECCAHRRRCRWPWATEPPPALAKARSRGRSRGREPHDLDADCAPRQAVDGGLRARALVDRRVLAVTQQDDAAVARRAQHA